MHPKLAYPIGGLLLASAFAVGIVTADDDDGRQQRPYPARVFAPDIPVATDAVYKEECGSCHFAYQPGLLPGASWDALMNGLSDHFGDNAELPAEKGALIRGYLTRNGADQVQSGRAPAFAKVGANPPLRISETPYFRRAHHELPSRVVKENPQVGSFSRCDACHTNAAKGSYNEHEVRIPGVGRWED